MWVIIHEGVWRGGFWGFRKPLLTEKNSKLTCLNKYTIINILASYAYLSANTI